jgi:uncharacterized membrane protein YphA (DoxX/SURF4 family)
MSRGADGASERSSRAAAAAGTERWRPWAATVARVGLGVVLVVAGWIKISSPDDAVRAVQAYQILPPGLTHAFGYGLPLAEILLGVLLVLGLGIRWAALGAGLLMAVFIGGVISVWVRGLSIDCGCFGGGGTTTPAGRNLRYSTEIARDVLFVGLASFSAVLAPGRLSLDGLLRGPAGHPRRAGAMQERADSRGDGDDGDDGDGWDDGDDDGRVEADPSSRAEEHRT